VSRFNVNKKFYTKDFQIEKVHFIFFFGVAHPTQPVDGSSSSLSRFSLDWDRVFTPLSGKKQKSFTTVVVAAYSSNKRVCTLILDGVIFPAFGLRAAGLSVGICNRKIIYFYDRNSETELIAAARMFENSFFLFYNKEVILRKIYL
jgi:hypothetical protein